MKIKERTKEIKSQLLDYAIKHIESAFNVLNYLLLTVVISICFYSLCSIWSNNSIIDSLILPINTFINWLGNYMGFQSDVFNGSIHIDNISSTIATVSGAIMAIVVTVSLFIIESTSKKSSYTIRKYHELAKIFVLYLAVIILAVATLFVHNFLLPLVSFGVLLILFIGFSICISLLPKYFHIMLEILEFANKPESQVRALKNEFMEAIKRGAFDEVEEISNQIGTSTIESIKQRDDRVGVMYIDALYGGFEQSIESEERENDKENEN